MSNKKFILNADDFGMSEDFNRAVLYGCTNGFLTSASLCANGEAFDIAINEILPECPNLGLGVHLNIIEGTSLTDCKTLTDKKGRFNNGFLSLLLKSNDKKFLQEVEVEFRAQIEKILKHAAIDHLDSHVHVHAIPNIFKIVCKLAKEYNISFVRTQFEEMYLVPGILKHINFKYPLNIIKILLLNSFTVQNNKLLYEYNLKTNDYIIGVGYTGLMDDLSIEFGLQSIEGNCLVEALIHPCCYKKKCKDQHYKEFEITQNKQLEEKIKRMDYEITNYKNLK